MKRLSVGTSCRGDRLDRRDRSLVFALVTCTKLPFSANPVLDCQEDIRYKVLWIGKISKHKGIGETKVLQGQKKAKVLWIYILAAII